MKNIKISAVAGMLGMLFSFGATGFTQSASAQTVTTPQVNTRTYNPLEQKAEMIPAYNPAQFEGKEISGAAAVVASKSELPLGYPVFKNTGNPELDNANYDLEKKAWVSNNSEVYEEWTKARPNSEKPHAVTAPAIQHPDIPSMKNTGNPEKDMEIYLKEKEAYKLRHPETVK